jgi:hypothetical protein
MNLLESDVKDLQSKPKGTEVESIRIDDEEFEDFTSPSVAAATRDNRLNYCSKEVL